MQYNLRTDIQYLRGVGPILAKKLSDNLGIKKIEDLLLYRPCRYVRNSLIKDIKVNEEVVTFGRIIEKKTIFIDRRKIFFVKISDGTGTLTCKFFNYKDRAIKKFKETAVIEVEGSVSLFGKELQIVNPVVRFSPTYNSYNFLPMYPLTQGITHTYLRKIIKNVIDNNIVINENLPKYIIDKEKLLPRAVAIRNLHFPENIDLVKEAIRRLEFEEIFFLQLLIQLKKKKSQKIGIKFNKGSLLARKFFNLLTTENKEFKLTDAQKRVCWEIFKDMESEFQMHRLLQGDVGSGKTIIAILSILKAVESGYQSVFMVPTEVLAEQHYFYFKEYFDKIGVNLRLLIGSISRKEKEKIYKEIENGDAQLIIGTHALIEEKLKFKNLGFVVIDEQHKFGVSQRINLVQKGFSPDILIMTATPIPRSLCLTFYGHLDISVIDEFPPGRGKIITRWEYEKNLQNVWEFIKSEIDKGRQCYIVYPIIEESEMLDLKAACDSYEKLRNDVFKNYKVGLLHGRMKMYEKTKIMNEFRNGKIDILVATPVIEVGIDVPNANCMVIEHANRFGIAQLHQLRGRIRRSKFNSYCFLISPENISADAQERLKSVEKDDNGFNLAEIDLKIRGPGELLGTKQHGFNGFNFANFYNTKLLSHIKEIVSGIVDNDPYLNENKILKSTIKEIYHNKYKFLLSG